MMANIEVLQFEPTDLEHDELQHELFIRNISGVSNPRSETNALRQVLLRETKGEEEPPGVSLLNSMEEMKNASIAFDHILELKNQAMKKGDVGLLGKIKSRTAAWINRMNRMLDKGLNNYNELLEKYYELYDAIIHFRRESTRSVKNKNDAFDLPFGSTFNHEGRKGVNDEDSDSNKSENMIGFRNQASASGMRNDLQGQT
jgi:hypothetical protein